MLPRFHFMIYTLYRNKFREYKTIRDDKVVFGVCGQTLEFVYSIIQKIKICVSLDLKPNPSFHSQREKCWSNIPNKLILHCQEPFFPN